MKCCFFPLLKTHSYALLSSLILSLRKHISQLFNVFPLRSPFIVHLFIYLLFDGHMSDASLNFTVPV